MDRLEGQEDAVWFEPVVLDDIADTRAFPKNKQGSATSLRATKAVEQYFEDMETVGSLVAFGLGRNHDCVGVLNVNARETGLFEGEPRQNLFSRWCFSRICPSPPT